MRKMFGIALLLGAFIQFTTEPLYSIPAFSRKYKTSCETCHNGFPKLTPFGEAFRRNGYQYPTGTDAEFTKEDPVPLGSEGNTRSFPDALWPGTLPGTSPLSVLFNGEIDYNPKYDPANPNSVERISFGGLGNSLEAIAAGNLGEMLSFWGRAILNSDGALKLNRMFLIFSNLVGNTYALNGRVGVIEPGLFSFSTHRAWLDGYWLTCRPFSTEMNWTLEETQKGIELTGMLRGRFGYSVGVVEGFGSPHSDKDYYVHATYKFGGMPLDGVLVGGLAIDNPASGSDNSLTVGAFLYKGSGVIGTTTLQSDDFLFTGCDFNACYDRFNLFGGGGFRHDDQPFLGIPGQSANSSVFFAETDVTVFPWLLPGIRYELWNGNSYAWAAGNSVSYTDIQIVPGIVVLFRANVKATVRTSVSKLESNGETKFSLGQLRILLTLGI